MRVDQFDFDLPADRIALRPASPRDSARLLVVGGAGLTDATVADLPDQLRAGDVLVFNDTRVIPAQLEGTKGEARIGVTLHKRIGPREWHAFVRNARRLSPGDEVRVGDATLVAGQRLADGGVAVAFAGAEPVETILARVGRMPLPPYIAQRRPADERDKADYQTRFARRPGAVAAPTAALHFTDQLMERLAARGVAAETLTLHVGAGTFLPVKVEDTADHVMHSEWGCVDADVAARLNAVRAGGGRIVAVGTTVLRLLESAWEDGAIGAWEGDTDIFLTPGRAIRSVDGLMTNFHLPRSTLMMLVSALMGTERMRAAYAHAIAEGYRFYSYGDASLLWPRGLGAR